MPAIVPGIDIVVKETLPQTVVTVSIVVLVPVGIQVPAVAPVPALPAPGVLTGVPLLLMIKLGEVVRTTTLLQDESVPLNSVQPVSCVRAERVSDGKEQVKEIPTYKL